MRSNKRTQDLSQASTEVTVEPELEQIFVKYNPIGNELGHFEKHKQELTAWATRQRIDELTILMQSYMDRNSKPPFTTVSIDTLKKRLVDLKNSLGDAKDE